MSFLKPDINYDPSKRIDMYVPTKNTAFAPEVVETVDIVPPKEFHNYLRRFVNNYTDADAIRFYKLANMTFKTSINVLDSISFLEKFLALYIGTLQKQFPNKNFKDIEESLFVLKESLAEILKHDNVENVYLLPMVLGIMESLLNYENY